MKDALHFISCKHPPSLAVVWPVHENGHLRGSLFAMFLPHMAFPKAMMLLIMVLCVVNSYTDLMRKGSNKSQYSNCSQ